MRLNSTELSVSPVSALVINEHNFMEDDDEDGKKTTLKSGAFQLRHTCIRELWDLPF